MVDYRIKVFHGDSPGAGTDVVAALCFKRADNDRGDTEDHLIRPADPGAWNYSYCKWLKIEFLDLGDVAIERLRLLITSQKPISDGHYKVYATTELSYVNPEETQDWPYKTWTDENDLSSHTSFGNTGIMAIQNGAVGALDDQPYVVLQLALDHCVERGPLPPISLAYRWDES